jgi:hypothetical protein
MENTRNTKDQPYMMSCDTAWIERVKTIRAP